MLLLPTRRQVLFLVALVIFLLPSRVVRAQNQEVIDEIVAIVGEKIILRSDVDGVALGLSQQRQIPYTDDLWHDALNQLIDLQVLAIHARRDTTLQVTDDQVQQALDDRIEQMTRQVGSTAEIERIYGKSLPQIREDLRDEFRDQMLAEQFQNRKVRTIRITPTEVERWFSRFPTDSLPTLPMSVRLAHVVRYPRVSDEARQEAYEIISAIRDSVVSGKATLEEMARLFSEDEGSAANGGRYTDMKLGDLVPEFAAMAARLDTAEVSEPFETEYGYHILRVDERRGDVVTFAHILISVDKSKADPTEALTYLQSVRDSVITHDLPFELLARRNSEEASTAQLGGRVVDPSTGERDLFFQALGPTWRDTIDTLDVGEISMPAEVELLDGDRAYHIVLLQRRTPEHRIDIETDYPRIEQLALQEKRGRVLQDWMTFLRDDVFIELRGKGASASEAMSASGGLTQQRN